MKVFTIPNPAVVAFKPETLADAMEHGGLLLIAGDVHDLNADGLTVVAGNTTPVTASATRTIETTAVATIPRRGGRRKGAGRKSAATRRGGDNLSDAGRRKLSRLMKARHAARKAAAQKRKAKRVAKKRTARKAKAQPQASAAAA